MPPQRYFYQIRSDDGQTVICDYKRLDTAEHDLPYLQTLYPGCEVYEYQDGWVKVQPHTKG